MTRRGILASLSTAAVAACSPLRAFSTFAPRDPARAGPLGLPYGEHPRQRMDIYAPRRTARPASVLIFFYGGNWDSGRRQDYAWVGHALAAQGFLAVLPDYRLVPEVRYPAFVEDGAAAVAAARGIAAAHGGDPDKVLASGHSAGAYIAAMLATNPAFLAAARVDPAVLRGFAGLSGPYDFFPFDVPASVAAFGRAPEPRLTQPVNLDLAAAPPAFLAHGTHDRLVRVRNSTALAERLRSAGRTVELKLYEGLDHKDTVLVLSRPFRRRAPVLGDMSRFLHAAAAAA